MASQKTKFTVGLFVVSGVCMSLIAFIWLGMSRYLEKGNLYVCYFDQSVQGLNKDSPVKYRGVAVGRVEKIGVAPDDNLIEVVMKIETGQPLDETIVARLKDVGITGSMFVELDRRKEGEPDRSPKINFPSEYPIVASRPSELTELLLGLDDVMKQIRSLDLKGISDGIKETLEQVNMAIADADVKGISLKIQSSLDRVDQMIVDADVPSISSSAQATLNQANRILSLDQWTRILNAVETAALSLNTLIAQATVGVGRADGTLSAVQKIVTESEPAIRMAVADMAEAVKTIHALLEKGTSLISGADESFYQLRRQVLVSVQRLDRATDNLNRFMESIADQPSLLILGEPPAPRQVEPRRRDE